VKENGDTTTISLERIGRMPMPIDLIVEYTDGTTEFLCSLAYDEFSKENPNPSVKNGFSDWTWAASTMILLSLKQKYYQKITIDPSGLMM
jgi:hypothetical protein